MQREPFDLSVIRLAGYDPATGTREVTFRNHRIYRCLNVPPAEWMVLEDAELARAYFAAHIRNAYACWRLVSFARVKHYQASPL